MSSTISTTTLTIAAVEKPSSARRQRFGFASRFIERVISRHLTQRFSRVLAPIPAPLRLVCVWNHRPCSRVFVVVVVVVVVVVP